MARLTCNNIEEILNVRLNSVQELEFEIRPQGENGTRWVNEHSIARQTLNCNKFKNFYLKKAESITSADDLKQFLVEQQIALKQDENEDKNQDAGDLDGSDQQLQQLSPDTMVKVKLGDQIKSLPIGKLQLLSYFKALLSDRWISNRNLRTTTIDIFGDGSNNVNISHNNNRGNNSEDNGDQVNQSNMNVNGQINFVHLQLLIKCAEKGKMIPNIRATGEILDGLANCNDFLMNKEDSVITVENLVSYFKNYNCKPKLNARQREIILQHTNNNTLKEAMRQYINELENKMGKIRLHIVNNSSRIRSMSNIKFDGETAFLLLKQRLTFQIKPNTNRNRISIKIINFTNTQEYTRLIYDCREKSRHLSLNCDLIIALITQLDEPPNRELKIRISHEQYDVVDDILESVLLPQSLHYANNEMEEGLFQSRLMAAARLRWRLCSDLECNWNATHKTFGPCVRYMNRDMVAKLADMFITTHSKHNQLYKRGARVRYYLLLRMCLLKCKENWLLKNADKWFPIAHENVANSVGWIMQIVNKMSTDIAFEFGMYLTKYIAYKRNPNKQFPQQYLDFLQDNLGIDWKLTDVQE